MATRPALATGTRVPLASRPTHPAWCLDLFAHPAAEVDVEGRALRVRATAPDHARYAARTDRRPAFGAERP